MLLRLLRKKIRQVFYRNEFFRLMVGGFSILVGRTQALGVSHLLSYEESNAIGPLQREEALLLFAVTRVCRPQTIVEFGFFHGHSAFNFMRALDPTARIYSYDLSDESLERSEEFTGLTGLRFIHQSQTSFDPADIDHKQIDLVLFDASHELDKNLITWQKLLPSLAPNALVFIHDTGLWNASMLKPIHETYLKSIGVNSAWPEGIPHQLEERIFVNRLLQQNPDFHAVHFHSNTVLRHGITLLSRHGKLPNEFNL